MPTLDFNLKEISPFDREFVISKDALLPDLVIQVLDGTTVVDLTGATLTFSMDDEDGVAKVNAAGGGLEDAVLGKVKYEWTGTDTDTAGIFFGQFVITLSSKPNRVPNNQTQRLIIRVGPRVN